MKNSTPSPQKKESNLPAIRPETQLAFQESRTRLRQALISATKINLALAACSGIFAYRASQHFWEQKGRNWWNKTRAFAKTAWLALKEDAFGGDFHIETLDIEGMLEEGRPTLAIAATPEAVDSFLHKNPQPEQAPLPPASPLAKSPPERTPKSEPL